MKLKIGDHLVQSALITAQQLDEALEAQTVFGGRLGTNLVELGFVTTAALAESLARQLGLTALVPSQLNEIHADALAAVDSELASEHMIVPLSLEKRKLRVAMADPTDLSAVDELAFRTGYQVIPVVAPELLVEYALEKFYDVQRVSRYVRIGANLDEQVAKDGPGVPEPPVTRPKQSAPTGRDGIREAVQDLVGCTKNSGVLSVLKRYLALYFERVVICVVDDERLRPWIQSGCVVPPEVSCDGVGNPLEAIEVDPTRSALCRAASQSQEPSLEPAPDAPGDRLLVKLLDPPPDARILVFPIQIKDPVEAVAFATGARTPEAEGRLGAHALFATKVSQAIQLVRLRHAILSL